MQELISTIMVLGNLKKRMGGRRRMELLVSQIVGLRGMLKTLRTRSAQDKILKES